MKPIKIGVLGLGTVATGVASILQKNSREIGRRIGRTIEIESVYVRSLDRDNPYNLNLTTDINDLIHNDEIDIIVELMGGINPAKEFIVKALSAKKDVVTANKELIALEGNALFDLAHANNVSLHFEASAAGGIPVIKTIREGLTANRINSLYGIINGTSNYILTEMVNNGRSFKEALKDAQKLGYAEADPTYDIKGIDAAHKLTILASISFGIPLNFQAVYSEGIDTLTADDIIIANHFDFSIKHLGIAKQSECSKNVEIRVHPTLIPKNSLFANTNGAMNAILIDGNAVGPIFNYGAGAGSEPTASAVIADIIDVIKEKGSNNPTPDLAFQKELLQSVNHRQSGEFQSKYMIKIEGDDSLQLENLSSIINQNSVDINDHFLLESRNIIALKTEETVEENILSLSSQLNEIKAIKNISFIRIETAI